MYVNIIVCITCVTTYLVYICTYVDEGKIQNFLDYFNTRRCFKTRRHKTVFIQSHVRLHAIGNIHEGKSSSVTIIENYTSDDQTQHPVKILIEGPPGIGKTSLIMKNCLQWASSQFHTFDKLLMFRNRERLAKIVKSTHQVCLIPYG